jgi:hypothetical protein
VGVVNTEVVYGRLAGGGGGGCEKGGRHKVWMKIAGLVVRGCMLRKGKKEKKRLQQKGNQAPKRDP